MGVFSEAILHGEEGLRIAEVIDHPYTHMHACFGIGLASIRQGEFIKAIPVLERGHTISQTSITTASLVNDAHLGYALALSGRVPEAISLLEDAVEQAVATRVLVFHSLWVAWLSEGYFLAGDLERAHTLALQALDCSQSRKEQGHQAYALRLLGDIAMHRNPPDIDQAETHCQQALTFANELGMRPLQAHCHRYRINRAKWHVNQWLGIMNDKWVGLQKRNILSCMSRCVPHRSRPAKPLLPLSVHF